MTCPRCRLRLQLSTPRPDIHIPYRRAFHTTPRPQRGAQLGAFTYPQEWQTGAYHFNKATQKTFPVATQHTDTLLNQWLTQQKKRQSSDSAAYQLMLKSSIAARRRKSDRIFVSKSTAKDFGDRVEVEAFIYDGVEAAAKAEEKRRQARRGVKTEGGEQGGRRKRPQRLRALGSQESSARLPEVRRAGGVRARAPSTGFRRPAAGGGGVEMRRLVLGGGGGSGSGAARTAGGVAPRG